MGIHAYFKSLNDLYKIKSIPLYCVTYFLDDILPDIVNEASQSNIDLRKITAEVLAS